MNKVKLTKEVAEQIESLRKSLRSNREIINAHRLVLGKGGWPSPRSPLNQIDVHTLQQAVMFGYEIDEPSGKITKFSDIKLGMLARPIGALAKSKITNGGIIDDLDSEDETFRFDGYYKGFAYDIGADWEIIDTALELPIEYIAVEPVCDDVTDLSPEDYKSMLAIAFLNDDDEWFAELGTKIKGVAE